MQIRKLNTAIQPETFKTDSNPTKPNISTSKKERKEGKEEKDGRKDRRKKRRKRGEKERWREGERRVRSSRVNVGFSQGWILSSAYSLSLGSAFFFTSFAVVQIPLA